MKNTYFIITVLLVLVVAGASFFAGMKYQQVQRSSFARQLGNGQGGLRSGGAFAGMGNRAGLRPVNGQIIGSDDKSITVKMVDGSSRIVLFSDKTTINKAAEATRDDLKVGETVAVFGQENTDGSVTAQSIQINPQFREGISPTPTSAPQQ